MKARRVLSMALAVMLELSSFAATGLTVAAASPDAEQEAAIEAEVDEEDAADSVDAAVEDVDPAVEESVILSDTTADGFKYELSSSGVMTITGYEGTATDITIPSEIDGRDVTAIGASAFKDHAELVSVTIPSILQNVGEAAFHGCTGLKNVTIYADLANASDGSARTNGIWNDDAYSVFYNAGAASGMTVTFGEKVKRIPSYLFATGREKATDSNYCKISKVVISSTVTEIGQYAFYNCWNLEELEGGDGVKTIGDYGFACTGFASYPSMKNVETLGKGAFNKCLGMAKANIGDSVLTIGDYAFADCNLLEEVIIDEPVTTIGNQAFINDSALKKVVLPLSLGTLGDNAFKNCTTLKDVTINSKELGNASENSTRTNGVWNDEAYSVFYNAGAASGMKVTFGEGARRVPAYLFATGRDKDNSKEYCKVSELYISSTVTEIGDYALCHCHNLEEIHFYGNAPKTIGENAFYSVEATAYYPKGNKTWKKDVMKDYGGTITWVEEGGKAVPVVGVTLNKSSVELGVGRSTTLKATITPSNATNTNVSWSSDNTSVATVDNNGKVTGVAIGEAVITVTTADGGKTATCAVKVSENAGKSGEEITLLGRKNAKVTAYVTFEPGDADEVDAFYQIDAKGKKAKLVNLHMKGYTFKGWYLSYTNKKGQVKEKKVKTLTATTLGKYAVDEELTLTAKFTPITYSIKYKVTKPAKRVKVKGKIKLTKAEKKICYESNNEIGVLTAKGDNLTAKGYTLVGWALTPGSKEVEIEIGETVSLEDIVPQSGKKIVLYSVWVPAE